jgi:hypothetical protein
MIILFIFFRISCPISAACEINWGNGTLLKVCFSQSRIRSINLESVIDKMRSLTETMIVVSCSNDTITALSARSLKSEKKKKKRGIGKLCVCVCVFIGVCQLQDVKADN